MIRWVKLTLKEENVKDFIAHFDTVKEKINAFPGCRGMKMLSDKDSANVFFTYSEWDTEEDLENYRHSALFGEVWPTVKQWFLKPAEAFSSDVYFDGFSLK
ncbi:antibiotic biosynthesis monooxygenase [Brumimicrobium salinarum]|uniref:Antibiotic biosynthesis monooxygenase n=1 Tax=Brumimicrobium salinarum TaxID=2058658 RepID=A0A2I0R323_9FLAO|nr:antibiotic biosynthesis monooxygenase family protein [Brumimicrobium salinarum]PKR80974.1 antibiotic biosynthesis monooxygenase [Brumimicrobium salinarum]